MSLTLFNVTHASIINSDLSS